MHEILAIHADFMRSNIADLIRAVCEDWCWQFIVFVCSPLCVFFVFTMYVVYDSHINTNNNNNNSLLQCSLLMLCKQYNF